MPPFSNFAANASTISDQQITTNENGHLGREKSVATAVLHGPPVITTNGSGDGRSATNSDDDGDGDSNRSSEPAKENRSR